jgi:hypothetical protein
MEVGKGANFPHRRIPSNMCCIVQNIDLNVPLPKCWAGLNYLCPKHGVWKGKNNLTKETSGRQQTLP